MLEFIRRALFKARSRSRHGVLPEQLTKGKRIVIVGDVHGCFDELNELLFHKIKFRNDGSDIAVFVGDLVAKGPKSREVVQLAIKVDAFGVRGNHDHYAISKAKKDSKKFERVYLNESETKWLKKLPFTLRIEEHGVTIVHAGVLPDRAISENEPDDMLHMRNVIISTTIDGKKTYEATSDGSKGIPWVDAWSGPDHIVFGHDAKRKLQKTEFATGLDSGCVYGGSLSAMILPERQVISVPSKKTYLAPGKPCT